MNCKKCGAMIEIGQSFCGSCGTPIPGMYGAMGSQEQSIPPQQASGSGIWAMVCGILALIFDCLTCGFYLLGMFSLVFGIFGIIYGGKEYRENKTPAARTGKEISIVALVLLICCVFINFFIFGVLFD